MNDKDKVPMDMMHNIHIALIDSDESIKDQLNVKFPKVYFESLTIDDIIRWTNTEFDCFKDINLIFIDTFYKDNKSDFYAIDFFEQYQASNSKHIEGTKDKHYVLVSIDKINEIISPTNQDFSIKKKEDIKNLIRRVRIHPYIEWGKEKGNKIDIIIEQIEKYAKENNLYLYRKYEMSYDEWIKYIEFYMYRLQTLIDELQELNEKNCFGDEMNFVIEGFKKIIEEAKEKGGFIFDNTKKATILSIIDFIEKVNMAVDKQNDNIELLFDKTKDMKLYSMFKKIKFLTSTTDYNIIEEKRNMQKRGDRID